MNSNVVYIIDEAQSGNYFHRKFYDVNVFLFFQMHRHLGCDIYLITQDARCLARELQQLAEYVIKAVRRSNSIGKSFTYKFYSGDECFKTKRIKQDQKVFGMYRSMIIGEGEKIKSIPFKHILIFVGLVVCAGIISCYQFQRLLPKNVLLLFHIYFLEAISASLFYIYP
jgi:zona occludens toxin (predicted ATPase)